MVKRSKCQWKGCKAKATKIVRRRVNMGFGHMPMAYHLCAKHATKL